MATVRPENLRIHLSLCARLRSTRAVPFVKSHAGEGDKGILVVYRRMRVTKGSAFYTAFEGLCKRVKRCDATDLPAVAIHVYPIDEIVGAALFQQLKERGVRLQIVADRPGVGNKVVTVARPNVSQVNACEYTDGMSSAKNQLGQGLSKRVHKILACIPVIRGGRNKVSGLSWLEAE